MNRTRRHHHHHGCVAFFREFRFWRWIRNRVISALTARKKPESLFWFNQKEK